MKSFLDTSVLVASFFGDHEHHDASFDLFLRQKKSIASTAGHCLAELYAVLTAFPGRERATPEQALLFVADVRERLTIVSLDPEDYVDVLQSLASNRISGGAVYDALIAQCAKKIKAETIFTWNVRDFRRFGSFVTAQVDTP